MLFLYRPRQTWMPYRPPRQRTEQAAYNRELQEKFGATRRVQSPVPPPDTGSALAPGQTAPASAPDVAARLEQLAQLYADGALSDDEFAAAKARVLDDGFAGP
jgi:Short C-terminal domain